MDFVRHREITLMLIGRSAIQLICVYDVYLGLSFHSIAENFVCLFVFVVLRPKSTAMVIAGRSVHLTTLFPGQA